MKHGLTLSFLAVVACFCIVAFLVLDTNPSLLRKKSAQGEYHPDSYVDFHKRGSFGEINLYRQNCILSTGVEGFVGFFLHIAPRGASRPSKLWFDWSIFPSVPPHSAFDYRFIIRTLTPRKPYDKWEDRSLHTQYALRPDVGQTDMVVIGDWEYEQKTAEKAQYQWQVVLINDGSQSKLIKHVQSGKCLQADGISHYSVIYLENCNPSHPYQKFD
jgi:hypothetical protein